LGLLTHAHTHTHTHTHIHTHAHAQNGTLPPPVELDGASDTASWGATTTTTTRNNNGNGGVWAGNREARPDGNDPKKIKI
jgi:hypothetical protein